MLLVPGKSSSQSLTFSSLSSWACYTKYCMVRDPAEICHLHQLKNAKMFRVVLPLNAQDDLLTHSPWWTMIITRQFCRLTCFLLWERTFLIQTTVFSKISHHAKLHIRFAHSLKKVNWKLKTGLKTFLASVTSKTYRRDRLSDNVNSNFCCAD